MNVAVLFDDLRRGGRGGKCEVVNRDVGLVVVAGLATHLLALADICIGADGEAVNGLRRFCRPFAEALRHERERGDEEKDRALRCHALGDAEGREGLARAARHDELATVGGREAVHDIGERAGLVLAEFLALAEREVLRAQEIETRPVHGTLVEIVDGDEVENLCLTLACVLGVPAPLVRRRDDHPGGESRRSRRGEEGVNVLLRNRVLRQVELALDGAKFARRALLRHDVYADVADVPFARPFIPHPHAGESLGVDGIEFKVAADEALEAITEIAVGQCLLAKVREDGVDGRFRHAGRAGFARVCESALPGGSLCGFLLVPENSVGTCLHTPRNRHLVST